jgi:hypothetical protein
MKPISKILIAFIAVAMLVPFASAVTCSFINITQGIQGLQGIQGIQGIQGETGATGPMNQTPGPQGAEPMELMEPTVLTEPTG